MPAHLNGKGIYVWQVSRALPYETLLENIARANLSHIIIKVAEGSSPYNSAYLPALIPTLRAAFPRLKIFGYQYLYCGCWFDRRSSSYQYNASWSTPQQEARTLAAQYRSLSLDGVVLDVEGEFEHYNQDGRAAVYTSTLRKELPDALVALSSFRYPAPNFHPDVPWATFAALCSIVMPQVYWMGNDQPDAGVDNLDKSYQQYKELYDRLSLTLEYAPTGAAFHENGWGATPAQVSNFLASLRAHPEIVAVNLWEYWFAAVEKPAFWDVLAKFEFAPPATPPAPPAPPPGQPKLLTVSVQGSYANVRSAPWGKILATIPDKTTLYAADSILASDGTLWWQIGSGYLANSVVTTHDIPDSKGDTP